MFIVTGHGICDYKTKSVSLPMATDNAKLIAKQCITLAKSFSIAPEDYRGVSNIILIII